jgi:thiamine biosynthesis protein ThiC
MEKEINDFKRVIDICITFKRTVTIKVGDTMRTGTIVARGEDFIELGSKIRKSGSYIIPLSQVVFIKDRR